MKTTNKIAILFFMYIVQKVFLSFSWALLPIILREQGASLGAIGFSALVYSPWCLKFLFAPAVDRYYSPRLGRRKSWIAPLLVVSGAALPWLALIPPNRAPLPLLGAVFAMNWLFATTDIAVDAYATDILQRKERAWGNAAQMIGYILGYMLGAGVLLIFYQHRGWAATVMAIAALQWAFTVPVLIHREIPPAPAPDAPGRPGPQGAAGRKGAESFLRCGATSWFLLFAAMLVIVDRGGSQLRLPLISDLGVNAAALGRLNIWVGAPLTILGSLAGGAWLNRIGPRRLFFLGGAGATALNFFCAFVSRQGALSPWHLPVMIGAEKFFAGIIFILIFSTIMQLSRGPRSATRYAVLASLLQLAGLGVMATMGALCDRFGYWEIYTFLGLFGVVTIVAAHFRMGRLQELETA